LDKSSFNKIFLFIIQFKILATKELEKKYSQIKLSIISFRIQSILFYQFNIRCILISALKNKLVLKIEEPLSSNA